MLLRLCCCSNVKQNQDSKLYQTSWKQLFFKCLSTAKTQNGSTEVLSTTRDKLKLKHWLDSYLEVYCVPKIILIRAIKAHIKESCESIILIGDSYEEVSGFSL